MTASNVIIDFLSRSCVAPQIRTCAINASGSSTDGLAARPSNLCRGRPSTPDAIPCGYGDRRGSHRGLRLVPPTRSVRRQRPSLPRVLRGAFPGCHGTTALCDSLGPSRRTRLPSPGATLRCACPFAPVGPGRPTAGLGCVSRSPPPAAVRREARRASQVPRQPRCPLALFSDPGRTRHTRPSTVCGHGPR
jgi:hypothetical protein